MNNQPKDNKTLPKDKGTTGKKNKPPSIYKRFKIAVFILIFPIAFVIGYNIATINPTTLQSNISVVEAMNNMKYDFSEISKKQVTAMTADGIIVNINGRNKVVSADISFKDGQNSAAYYFLESLYPGSNEDELNKTCIDLIEKAKKYNYEEYKVFYKGDVFYSQKKINESDGSDYIFIKVSIP